MVLGSRSAIFVPQPDVGLIILDEEHEWTYKQADAVPRYHARAVARKLGEYIGATVVLGSATPDVGEPQPRIMVHGHYFDTFVRTPDGWRIKTRGAMRGWSRTRWATESRSTAF